MPHRRRPESVARNFLTHSAFYDCKAKESINTVSSGAVLCVVGEVFPGASSDDLAKEVFEYLS